MTARIVGRDLDDLLVADGPVGAIVQPGQPPRVLPVASLLAHREFDPADAEFTADPQLIADLAEARSRWESGR